MALESVRVQIRELRQKVEGERFFIDPEKLKTVLVKAKIKDILQECRAPIQHLPEHIPLIAQAATKLFGLLLLIGLPLAVVTFIEHDQLDSKMPFEGSESSITALGHSTSQFLELQWEFIPHFFKKRGYAFMPKQRILPISEEKRMEELDGSFGFISTIKIEPNMHDLLPRENKLDTVFIRKRLRPRKNTEAALSDFRREDECLTILRRLRHRNIVELLCSFTRDGEHNLIFPRMEMNLREFLEKPERFGYFSLDRTFYQAIWGLSSAIDTVHNLNLNSRDHDIELARVGYHHDIRPANILVTHETFLLADFGLSRIKDADEGSTTEWKGGLGDYIAPESMDSEWKHLPIGRPIDIWAFGCMLVEIATYMAKGSDGVQQARKDRIIKLLPQYSNSVFFLGESLRPQVASLISGLQKTSEVQEFRTLLYVATTVLQCNPDERPLSSTIVNRLWPLALHAIYRDATSKLLEFVQCLSDQGDDVPPKREFHFEQERLQAWGLVLGMASGTSPELARTFEDSMTLISQDLIMRSAEDLLKQLINELSEKASTPRKNFASSETYREFCLAACEEVRLLINQLCNLLPLKLKKRMDLQWQESLIRTKDVSTLIQRKEASSGIAQEEYAENSALLSMRSLQVRLAEVANDDSKAVSLRLHENQLDDVQEAEPGQIYTGRLAKSTTAAGSPGSSPVVIEEVEYSSAWDGQSTEQKVLRIQTLARLLSENPKPENFRVLDCLGFIAPLFRPSYSFIYAFPSVAASEGCVPRSLRSLLGRIDQGSSESKVKQPSLEQKVRLAQALVETVLALHKLGWLHKALNSGNVLFFPPPDRYGRPDLSQPYLVNFRQSRPQGQQWFTEGPSSDLSSLNRKYQHPEYLQRIHGESQHVQSRYRKKYDYYSLGMILLEIGRWGSLDFLTRQIGQLPSESSLITYRDYIIKQVAPRLYASMGRIFAEAVITCLKSDFDDTPETDGDELQTSNSWHFYTKVVEPMREIYVG